MMDRVETAIPYVMPVLGGFAGVIYMAQHRMDQPNPMYWIGGGILLGFIVARLLLNLMSRFR